MVSLFQVIHKFISTGEPVGVSASTSWNVAMVGSLGGEVHFEVPAEVSLTAEGAVAAVAVVTD